MLSSKLLQPIIDNKKNILWYFQIENKKQLKT